MKKLSVMLLSMLLLFVFTGCSSDNEQNTAKNKETQTTDTKTNTNTKQIATNKPIEPTHEDVCYFCNMKIYTKNEEMGASTAQAIKADGTHVFFDDSGCMTNAEKKYNEKFTKKWVRDYVTSDWIEADKAVVVKADVATPMKYGYAFFADEESANKYMNENNTNGAISNWTAINTEAAKRYQMRMKKEGNMDMKSNGTMNNSNNMQN